MSIPYLNNVNVSITIGFENYLVFLVIDVVVSATLPLGSSQSFMKPSHLTPNKNIFEKLRVGQKFD